MANSQLVAEALDILDHLRVELWKENPRPQVTTAQVGADTRFTVVATVDAGFEGRPISQFLRAHGPEGKEALRAAFPDAFKRALGEVKLVIGDWMRYAPKSLYRHILDASWEEPHSLKHLGNTAKMKGLEVTLSACKVPVEVKYEFVTNRQMKGKPFDTISDDELDNVIMAVEGPESIYMDGELDAREVRERLKELRKAYRACSLSQQQRYLSIYESSSW